MVFHKATTYHRDHKALPWRSAMRGLSVIGVFVFSALGIDAVVAQSPVPIAPPGVTAVAEPIVVIDQRAADKIRGGYVYSFTRFVTWQKPTRDSFQIAIVGNSRLAKLMSSVAKRKRFTDRLTGRKVPIHTQFYENTTAIAQCDLLYIGTSVSSAERSEILKQFANSSTLLITDDTTAEHLFDSSVNATARFVLQGGSVKFQLNLRDARQRDLKIDAKLLTAASMILPDDGTNSSSGTLIKNGAN